MDDTPADLSWTRRIQVCGVAADLDASEHRPEILQSAEQVLAPDEGVVGELSGDPAGQLARRCCDLGLW